MKIHATDKNLIIEVPMTKKIRNKKKMKAKIRKPVPNKIKMFGYDWKIKYEQGEHGGDGGSVNWSEKEIRLNDKYGESKAILLHEIMEAILIENLTRFYGIEAGMEYRFFFNHTQFCKIVKDIFQTLEDNNLLTKKN